MFFYLISHIFQNNYDQLVARDESVFEIVSKINESIEKTSSDCKKSLEYFNAYSFLWTVDIHVTFEEFLKGNSSFSKSRQQPRPPSKNFMNTRNVTKLDNFILFFLRKTKTLFE